MVTGTRGVTDTGEDAVRAGPATGSRPRAVGSHLGPSLAGAYRSWWTAGVVAAVLFVVSLTAVPLLITFDGHYYLSGSRVLFTEQAPDLFWWLRQPGYSVFLRAVASGLSPSDLWFTATQAVFLVVGGTLASVAVWRSVFGAERMPGGVLAACLALGIGNAGVLLYAPAILQQSTFVLALGVGLYLASRLELRPSWSAVISAIALVVVVALVQKEFARLLVLVLATGVLLSREPRWPRPGTAGIGARVLRAGVTVVVLQLCVTVALLPWEGYKADQLERRSANAPAVLEAFPSIPDQIRAAASFNEPHEHGLLSQLGGFVGFRGSTQVVSEPVERELYIGNRTEPFYACGYVEGMPTAFDHVYQTSLSGIDTSCRSVAAMQVWRPYVDITLDLYPFVLALGLLAAVASLARWRGVLPAATVLGLSATYTLMGFGADRYSVPVFPAAAALIVVTLVSAGRAVARRRNRGRAGAVTS